MKVQVFAVLKDHFDKEFEIEENISDAAELRSFLIQSRPGAEAILNNCRFAVNDEFVDLNFKLQSYDTVTIIPPSSGG
jgi:molybdopterin synthase sulfur carrier subunit